MCHRSQASGFEIFVILEGINGNSHRQFSTMKEVQLSRLEDSSRGLITSTNTAGNISVGQGYFVFGIPPAHLVKINHWFHLSCGLFHLCLPNFPIQSNRIPSKWDHNKNIAVFFMRESSVLWRKWVYYLMTKQFNNNCRVYKPFVYWCPIERENG